MRNPSGKDQWLPLELCGQQATAEGSGRELVRSVLQAKIGISLLCTGKSQSNQWGSFYKQQ